MIRAEAALHPRPSASPSSGRCSTPAPRWRRRWCSGRIVDEVVEPRFEGGGVAGSTVAWAMARGPGWSGSLRAGSIVLRRGMAHGRPGPHRHDPAAQGRRAVRAAARTPTSRPTPPARCWPTPAPTPSRRPPCSPRCPSPLGVVVLVVVAAAWLLLTDLLLAVVGLLLLPGLLALNTRLPAVDGAPGPTGPGPPGRGLGGGPRELRRGAGGQDARGGGGREPALRRHRRPVARAPRSTWPGGGPSSTPPWSRCRTSGSWP